MEKTNRLIKQMQQRQEAASQSRTRSPVSPRSRSSSANRGGARSRNYSGSSIETGGDYSSGQDEYFSAEEETRPHGRSILTSRNDKVGLKDFTPTGFNDFDQVCNLLSDGNQLERRVNDHFRAQFKNTKASHRELQTQYYSTELTVCKDAMNKDLIILGKDMETQNNEKFRLNSTMRVFDSQANEKREASNNLQMVMAGFKSSVNVERDQTDVKMLIDQIKTHMTATMSTPLVGQDLTGINEGKSVSLGIKLSQETINKLGKFKPNYESCVNAQKRYNAACAIYSNTEKE